MAKLDWGKASMRETDPARVQRTHDFVEPDRVIISVQKLTKAERKKLATEQNARRRKKPVKKKVVAKPKPMLIAKLPKKQRPQLSEEEKRLAYEARQIANAEHQRRYLAKAAHRLKAMEGKKKTPLQAWAEKQEGVRGDRTELQQTWRAKLLRDGSDE